jgi:hypothetical protein
MNYWNIAANAADAAAILAEDKPVAKAIIGGVKEIVAAKGTGVSNTSIVQVVTAMSKSKWNDLGSDELKEIAEIIGEDMHLDLKTDAAEKDTGWLGKLWGVISIVIGIVKPLVNPDIAKILGYVDVIVAAKDTGISNDSIKSSLIAMSKSAWNDLDSKKIAKIMTVITKK